jgi:rhodanese-related sulfurtransferase
LDEWLSRPQARSRSRIRQYEEMGTMEASSEISRDELRNGLRSGELTLVDVLPAESYAMGHIPGAISLPFEYLTDRARELLPDLHAQIVVYCAKFT